MFFFALIDPSFHKLNRILHTLLLSFVNGIVKLNNPWEYKQQKQKPYNLEVSQLASSFYFTAFWGIT